MIPFQKIIAWFLIGLLCFEATFRVPLLLPGASALESSDHEDVVSLLVEEELFKKMSSDIDTYARRIQTKLPHTRTVILTYARDAHPYLIASANERLYFSGLPDHGKKTQKLVGTILIGHVPLPVVHKDEHDFLSLYPYTDFDEPHFFWNWETSRYEYTGQKQDDPRPDIWHSVIDPNTGSIDTDVTKIRDFFTRVYEFDEKKGRYQNVGINPQVLYMDSINESRSASKGLLAVYEQIFTPQQEHLLYHRYTRDFAQYLYAGFLSLMESDGATKLSSFRDWKADASASSSFLNQASDITTKVFGKELITPFLKVINEKYLGDLNRWVHNTGRYYNGYSEVRVDTLPELITTKDALAGQIIKESNDVLEKMIDNYADANLSLDIPILVSRPAQKTIIETETVGGKIRQVSRTYNFVYDNYFYGTKASTITSAAQCSLIRGSSFGGRNTTVETNHGYNVLGAQDDAKNITNDTNAGIKCTSPTQSYWGGNSPMNASYTNGEMTLKTHRYDDFSLPVLDLATGKRTTGVNSPLDCLRNDQILRPYQHNGLENRKYLWPTETGGTRYSCATPLQSPTPNPFFLDPTPETSENILSSLVSCSGTGTITLLNRNGGSLGLCQSNGLTGTYKRIPSLVKHSDPVTQVYGKQLQGNTAPNLPIDEERYLLYLDRTGAQARIDYPNLFDISVNIDDTDEMIVTKIQSALTAAQNRLIPATTFPLNHRWGQLIQSSTTAVNLADVLLSNADIRAGLIDALRWRQLDIEMKYAHVLETALTPTTTNSQLILPEKKDLYEISYLGGQGDARNFVFGFSPEEKSDLPEWFTDIQEAQGDVATTLGSFSSDSNPEYSLSTSEIATLLGESATSSDGTSEEDTATTDDATDDSSSDDECGDPEGVVIWEWLSAIQCWLSDLMKTEWFTPEIDDLGFPELPSLTVSLGGDVVWSTKEIKDIEQTDTNDNDINDYVEENKSSLTLINTLSSTTLEPTQTLRIDTSLEDSTTRINDDLSHIDLEVTRIDDLDEKKSYSSRDADWTGIQNRYFSVSGSSELKDGHAIWIFTSRNNHRARVTFESRIYSGTNVFIRSERSTVLIGPITLGVTVLGSSGSTTSETVTAGDSNGLNILLTGLDTYPSTAEITVSDYVTGKLEGTYKAVPITDGKIRLGSPTIDTVIKRASRYTLTVVAGDYSGKTHFTIAPDKPHHIDITLASLLIKDTPEKMLLILKDVWGNTVNSSDWNIQVESSANITLSPLSSTLTRLVTGKFQSPLTLVPLESGSTTLTFTMTKDADKITTTFSRPVLSDAHMVVDIPNRDTLEVGQEVPVNFSIQRQDGTLIDNWDMSVKIGIRGGDAKLSQETLTFSGGEASTTIKTGTRTGTVVLYLQDTGLGKIVGDSFIILPGTPTNLALTSPEILYAKTGARDTITATIYDAYGNLTTLHDNTLKITVDKPTLLEALPTPREIQMGIFETDIVSKGYPGRILFRAWLEKDGQKSSIATLENVSETNILPVITSEEASQNSWQNLTQVLLGAAFGQTPIQGYFGGSTLFAPSTKTLALSTLIDTPENPIFTLTPSGNIVTGSLQYGTGVEVQIESYLNNILALLVYDTRLGSIARIRYPLMSNDRSLTACTSSCDHDTMYFIPASSDVTYKDGGVYKNGQKLFTLSDIFSFPNLSFAFIHQTGENLQFVVTNNGVTLGTLSLRWKARVPSEVSSVDTTSTFTLESLRSTLLTKLAWSSTSSFETPSLILYSPDSTSSYLGGAHTEGWSAYSKKYGLGWTDDNTSMLQFAAGQEWSDSIRNHADYLTINLGDPIINLPNYDVNSIIGLDQTVGEPVYVGDIDVDDFTFKDANSDGKKDLITYHSDGTVGMSLSRGDGSMIDVGDLLSVSEAQKDMVRAGDFIGDGYADIVYVDGEGILHQVTHDNLGPIEKPMQYDVTPLLGQIEQIEVFDMDHDGVDDIIVLDHLGSLYIFYGHPSGVFRTQLIENVYDFILSDEAKTSYFTGAIRYTGSGFVDPDDIPKTTSFELQTKQDQVNQMIFTQIHLAKETSTSATTPTETLGTTVVNNLDVDENGFLRMYDGDSTTISSSLQFGYDTLGTQGGDAVSVLSDEEGDYETFDLLKAPFIIPGYISVTKQYRSLEESGQVLAGSPIEVQINIKNVSQKSISNILLLEKFADYLSVSEMQYDLVRGTTKETREFLTDSSQSDSGIADLRDVVLTSGSSMTLIYSGTLRSFSFGRFDVGYLEDKNDPTSSSAITQDKIRTINTSAAKLTSIPENDFYNHDVYGDIRFNPNETCGGPTLLWRSHNVYDRTYHKTIIVREITDPDENATQLSQDPTDAFDSTTSSSGTTTSTTSSGTSDSDASDILAESESELATWQSDSDADEIPDKDDDDSGDVFEISTSGNTTKISVSLGEIDDAVDEIVDGVKEVLSGLSCGFGDPGCISMPINWAPNAPGNTVTLMGYAVPGINTPPLACHKSVLCGYPIFAYPTDCCTSTSYYDLMVMCPIQTYSGSQGLCTWPSAPRGAGGALDYQYKGSSSTAQTGNGLNDAPSASGSVTGLTAPTFEAGLGISQYRLWITPTLTGAIAEIFCFGPNTMTNPTINLPGLFPITFQGNCIFATQPLFQCEDDGSEEEPLVEELDVSDELSEETDDGNGDGDGSDSNRFTNADECGFFEPIDSYPSDLSQATSAYFTQTNDTTVTALQTSISENADLVNDTSSSDTALEFSTTAPSSAYERLNGTNGLEYEVSNGTGMLQIALDPSAMKFKDFGKVIDINLKSIKGFPNFIMDWYQRQMDEIMSSLTHLPDLKIFLPDLSSISDAGWMSNFASGMGQQLGNIVSPSSTPQNTSGTPTSTSSSQIPVGNNSLTLEQSNALQAASSVPTTSSSGCLQCGEFANNYIEKLTGVGHGPFRDSYSSKQALRDTTTPTVGSVMIYNTGSSNGHAAVVTGADENNVYVYHANGNTGALGAGTYQRNDPRIYGYHIPGSSSSSSASSSSSSTTCTSGTCGVSSSSSSGLINNTVSSVQSGWNSAFNGLNSGLNTLGSGLGSVLGGAQTAANSVASVVKQKTAGIQNAFEYLGTLPIIDVHPETISFDIPWVGKQEAQSWIIRNEAILQAWRDLPGDAVNSIGVGGLISSIESNIETVRTYLELPERLQTLFYLKEKLLYGILQNVKAVQDLMGGWLYKNGLRFKGWVEAFILITKLFDLWQVLLDVFNDYEVECGECRNERWNLQHWLWIVISAIIPEIPVIQMPRWPDIELDFSDIDLSLDIAYPVFALNFYPVSLPDAPAPTISGFALDPMPQLPQIPSLNIDFEIPVIKLPKLPDLPPPPKVPELSEAISVVLKIFKLLVLIQCLYRKIPLSPEWYVGTKVAHKTERQGYLPFDFLDSRMPSVTMEWLEAIRVSTHVKLEYDVDFIIDMLKEALEPFTNFPRNLNQSSGGSNTVDININPDTGVKVETSSSSSGIPDNALSQIPTLIGALFAATSETKSVDPNTALDRFTQMVQKIDISPKRRKQLDAILEKTSPEADLTHVQKKLDTRFDQITQAIDLDVKDNVGVIDDLIAWANDTKKPEEIPLIAERIPGTAHLAKSGNNLSHLLALETSIINPLAQLNLNRPLVAAPLLSVTPTPDVVETPGTGNDFENMVETQDLTQTRGLYVTHGSTTQRLIDYTENLDESSKIHTVDDDGDGDLDVYYTIGNIVYRKENYSKTPNYYTIKDAPKVYASADIYEDFFGIKNSTLASLPSEGQINLLQTHTAERVRYQILAKNGQEHTRLRLFRSLFETDPLNAQYQVDIIPENKNTSSAHTLSSVPSISDIDGLVFIERNKIYRTLITGQQFINEDGEVEDLSSDFVIRSGQSGYTGESTTLDVTSNSKTTQYKMIPGQRITFASDSKVLVKKGSLILFGNTTEKKALTIRDTYMPLLPGDLIITDENGGMTVKFPDGAETEIGASQHWSFTQYVPGVGVKKLTLPVEAEWYYGSLVDARSMEEVRLPHGTVFDAYTNFSESDVVSQIPRDITLSLPSPTEIDFQIYFPADTLTNVEIFRLPSSQWRRISSTKIAFESQEESVEILVRVTTSERIRDYTTRIVTTPPKLYIDTVNTDGAVSGKISYFNSTLPMGIQSYLDKKSWTLATGFTANPDNTFTTSIPRSSSKFSLIQGTTPLATFDRSSSVPTLSTGATLVPNIVIGKPLEYSLRDNTGERLRVTYQSKNIAYRQVATLEEMTNSGIFVIGTGLRLEPATVNDTTLKGGAYITDTSYRPLVTFDSEGVIRTLDTNISWSVKSENNHLIFTLTRDRIELGKIIVSGNMITTWGGE